MPSNPYTDYTLLLAHRACSLYCRLSHYVSRVYLPYLPLGSNPQKTKTIISKHLEESLLCRKKVLTQCLLAEKREERNIGRNVSGYSRNSSQPFTAMQSLLGRLYVSYIFWTDLFLLHFMPLTHDTHKSCPLNFSTLFLLLFPLHCHCLNVGPHFSPG